MAPTEEQAILAGGCFRGMQDLLRRYPGVISTRVGYSGGDVSNATYGNHGSHAETIEVTFDPRKLSYGKLLEYFFQIHDPTTLNRQGNGVGTSYCSAPGKVVTEVKPAGQFWEAGSEHQDSLELIRTAIPATMSGPIGDYLRAKPNVSAFRVMTSPGDDNDHTQLY